MFVAPLLRFWFRVLFWSYGRGTWQYDVLCGAIIAFLLLTPNSMFFAGVEKDPTVPAAMVVGLKRINSDLYVLMIINRSSPEAPATLEQRLAEFDRATGNRFARVAIYDDDNRKLGYVLSAR